MQQYQTSKKKLTMIFQIFNTLMTLTAMANAAYLVNPMAIEEARNDALTGVHEDDRFTTGVIGNTEDGHKHPGAYGLGSSNSENRYAYAGLTGSSRNSYAYAGC